MEQMHSLLKRQLKRHFDDLDSLPKEWQGLLDAVNKAYWEFDADRCTLERSLDLSSQELLQANSEMRAVFQAFPDLFFRLDSNGTILDYKAGSTADLYLSPEKLLGKRIQDIPLENVGNKFQEAIRQVRKTNSLVSIEYSLRIEKREHFYEARLLPVLENQVIVIVRNITERKKAEEALRKSENRYRSSIELTNQVAWTTNANGEVVEDIPVWRKYTGQSYEDAKGYGWSKALHPDDTERTVQVWTQAVETKSAYETEYRIRRYDGIYRDFLARGIPVFKEDGTVQEWVGTCIDITERKRAEEALKESEERLKLVLEGAELGTWDQNMKTGEVIRNRRWAEMLGYTLEEIDPHTDAWKALIHPDDLPEVNRITQDHRAGRTPFLKCEHRMRTKSGEWKWILNCGKIIQRDSDGKPVRATGTHTDITERKRAEEALQGAKEQAEEANRLKSEFLANMSHEIRTPMNAIIGMTDLTLNTELTEEQCDYLKTAKESAQALLGLLNDILDFSKIEAGRVELETIDFDLRTTIEGVADTLAHRASSKGLELACMIHPQVPTLLRGDTGRLRQILMNLGGNAVRFTEKGEVVIQVELQKETEDRATLLFSVTDTGIGISKDKHEKIFESFTQVDGSTTRKYGGSGLGLSISRRLVEVMGGQIGVESQPGKGSRFWFTVTFEKQKEFKEISLTLPPDIRGLRMLVIDDNQTNRAILLKMLESFGCYAEAVEGGAKALQVLKRAVHKEKLFDLVLLDMQMPQMDGEQTLRAIKTDPELKDVLVIILTSIGISGDVARLEALGCAGYLTKPVKQSQLFDTILTVLSRQKAQAKEKPISIVTRHTVEEQKSRRVHILLAEDNPMNQKLAVTLLKKAGYSVDAVEDGRMVMEAVKRRAYDLILMDVQMPEMNGFDATQAIRAKEGEAKHTPIIAMTAHAMRGDRERCLQASMDDYISKPIEPQELLDVIEKWTKSQGKEKDLSPFTLHLSPQKSEPALSEHIEPIEPIDLESTLRRFDGDKDFFREMLQEFLSYAPKQLEKLAEAIKMGDAKVVETEAHSLKGAAGNLGAKPMADLALQLELLGRKGDLAVAEEIVCNLRTAFEHLEVYINKSLLREGALKS
jgi:PAS domain S-box-containing protein